MSRKEFEPEVSTERGRFLSAGMNKNPKRKAWPCKSTMRTKPVHSQLGDDAHSTSSLPL